MDRPINDEWYVVSTPNYCESGMQIAIYDNGKWITDTEIDITNYVIEWVLAPSFEL